MRRLSLQRCLLWPVLMTTLCLYPMLHAETRYVSTLGSDTQDGSAEAPFATIQRALWQIEAGDVVEVAAGTYAGFVLSQEDFSGGEPVTVRAAEGATVRLDAPVTTPPIVLMNAHNVVIEGLTLGTPTGTPTSLCFASQVSDIVLRDLTFSNVSATGIYAAVHLANATGVTLERVAFNDILLPDANASTLWVQASTAVVLNDCSFLRNRLDTVLLSTKSSGSLALTGTDFVDNYTSDGSAFTVVHLIGNTAAVTFTDCVWENTVRPLFNTAANTVVAQDTAVSFSGCRLSRLATLVSLYSSGGAFSCIDGRIEDSLGVALQVSGAPAVTVQSTTFENNPATATALILGGSQQVSITGNTFRDNRPVPLEAHTVLQLTDLVGLATVTGNTFENSSAQAASDGSGATLLLTRLPDGADVSGNTFARLQQSALVRAVDSSAVAVENNTFSDTLQTLVALDNVATGRVRNNTFTRTRSTRTVLGVNGSDAVVVEANTLVEPVYGKTLYVAPSGDDGASGLSTADPLASVAQAILLADPGDTIELAAGDYASASIHGRDFSADPVTIRPAAGATVRLTSYTDAPPLQVTHSSGLRVEDLHVIHASGAPLSQTYIEQSSKLHFVRCQWSGFSVSAAYAAVHVLDTADLTFEDCSFADQSLPFAFAATLRLEDVAGVTLDGCHFLRNRTTDVVYVHGTSADVAFVDTLFSDNYKTDGSGHAVTRVDGITGPVSFTRVTWENTSPVAYNADASICAVLGTHGVTFTDCAFEQLHGFAALYLDNCSALDLDANAFTGNLGTSLLLRAIDTAGIEGNTFVANQGSPVVDINHLSRDLTLRGNTFTDHVPQPVKHHSLMLISDCRGSIVVEQNTFENTAADPAIDTSGSSIYLNTLPEGVTVRDNTFVNLQQFALVHTQQTSGAWITGNRFENTLSTLVYLDATSGGGVTGNHFVQTRQTNLIREVNGTSGVDFAENTFEDSLSGKVLYVDAVQGSSANNGLSADFPLRTIQEALDRADPGDTVLIAAGTYDRIGLGNVAASAEAPLTLRALSDGVVLDPVEPLAPVILVNCTGVRLEGFSFTNDPDQSNLYAYVSGSEAITFSDCAFRNATMASAVLVEQSSAITFEGCDFAAMPALGIDVNTTAGITVRDCSFTGMSGREALLFSNATTGISILDTTFAEHRFSGSGDGHVLRITDSVGPVTLDNVDISYATPGAAAPGMALALGQVDAATLDAVTFTNVPHTTALFILESSDIAVSDAAFTNSLGQGVFIEDSSAVQVTTSTFTGGRGDEAVLVSNGSSAVTVSDNLFANNFPVPLRNHAVLRVFNAGADVALLRNRIVQEDSATSGLVMPAGASASGIGIFDTATAEVVGNTVENIQFSGTVDLTVVDPRNAYMKTAAQGGRVGFGINIEGSAGAPFSAGLVAENRVSRSGQDGITLRFPEQCDIRSNTAHDNGAYGIVLLGDPDTEGDAGFNRVFYNETYGNGWQHGGMSGIAISGADPGNIVRANLSYGNLQGTPGTVGADWYADGLGIICDLGAHETVVENNIVWNNQGAGIGVIKSAHCSVVHNTVVSNGFQPHWMDQGGIVVTSGDEVDRFSVAATFVANNLVYDARMSQIFFEQESDHVLRNNLVAAGPLTSTEGSGFFLANLIIAEEGLALESGTLEATPLFRDALGSEDVRSFYPVPESPGVGAGVALTVLEQRLGYRPASDYWGNPRSVDAPTLGATTVLPTLSETRGSWGQLEGLGRYFRPEGATGWIFAARHGWLYLGGEDLTAWILYAPGLGWLQTDFWFAGAPLYPVLWAFTQTEWLQLQGEPEDLGPRTFAPLAGGAPLVLPAP